MIQIQPNQLNDWLAQLDTQAKPVVLDVREPHEFELASPNANEAFEIIRMPMRSVPEAVHALDKDRPIACLCHHGSRSMQVAMFLENMGYAVVANISGGIDAWSTELDTSVPRY
ncbi:sulfurtransferase [Comamonadaceae bacterium M7527]|nr:sulfurtransferase [Comamonadaceae bacterium M7527]